MKALLLSPARLRERSLVERVEYYQKLLRARLPLRVEHVRKGSLLDAVPARWRIIALDERGDRMTSRELAERVKRFERDAFPGIAFLVGAADGLQPEERDGAHERWSLSDLTFPHQFCFAMLAEQLYRATAINRGEPYHRD